MVKAVKIKAYAYDVPIRGTFVVYNSYRLANDIWDVQCVL
jgi:hypothetical protein